MTHFDFYFADKKSMRKSIRQALGFLLFYIVSSIILLYIVALAEPFAEFYAYNWYLTPLLLIV